ncbi:MAG: o-succinylbenzoate synthase [Actinomycetota bacterium]
MLLPSLSELRAHMHVVTLDLNQEFRGVTARELVVFEGPSGWGEFAPFHNHSDRHSANWLMAAIESAFGKWPTPIRESFEVNAIIPMLPAREIENFVRASHAACGFKSFKMKCGSENLSEDVDRVSQLRATLNQYVSTDAKIRIDINGAWTVADAIERIRKLDEAAAGLEYVEQPSQSLEECALIRREIDVPIAIDEGIRLLDDARTQRTQIKEAGDIAVLKAIPLGGVERAKRIAEELAMPVVVSGSLDSSIGLASGAALAASLAHLDYASGLGTGLLLKNDLSITVVPHDSVMSAFRSEPDEEMLAAAVARTPHERVSFWEQRLTRCYEILEQM